MMNRLANTAVLPLCFVASLLFAAPRLQAEDFPPISPEDLALKDNPAQPGADAMILYRDNVVDAQKVREGGDSDEEFFRIKIFTKAGIRYADVKVPYLKESMNVYDVAGRTIHPDGSVVKFDGKVLDQTITELSGYKYLAKTFTLPDVQPGSIIEYRYRKQGEPNYLHSLEWEVSQDMFTREAHFTMKPYEGDSGYSVFFRPYNLPPDAVPKQEGMLNIFTMVARNIPAIVDEPLMPGKDALESSVSFYYEQVIGTETPDKFWTRNAKKWNGEMEKFIDKKDALKAEVGKAVGASDPPEAKLQKLYARAQQIRNLSDEDERTKQELKTENIKQNSNVSDVLKNGYGYGHEINYLFIGLARAAGFEASEVRIAPVGGQIFNPGAEDTRQLDDDIVWVSAGGKEYYVDPAAHFYPFNLLPWYEQGAQGIRVDKPSPLAHTGESSETDAGITRHAEVTLSADGTTAGKISIDFRGQEAGILREENRQEDETGRKNELEKEIKGWLPVGTKLELTSSGPWDDNAEPLHVEGTVTITGVAAAAGQRILLPIEIFGGRYEDVFSAQKRVNFIDFRYRFEDIDDIKMTAPAGYTVASVPNPGEVNAGAVVYNIEAKAQGNVLEVKRDFAMKGVIFEVKFYPSVRNLFGAVKNNDSAQAILSKSN